MHSNLFIRGCGTLHTGILKDEQSLSDAKLTPGTKLMIVGSTVNDVIAIQPPDPSELKKIKNDEAGIKQILLAMYDIIIEPVRETLSESKEHKRIIEKGKPEDILPAYRHRNDPLPSSPLSGMLNKYGGKVRLHFKLELEQVWISTKGKYIYLLEEYNNVFKQKGQRKYH